MGSEMCIRDSTNKDNTTITCILTRPQLTKLKRELKNIDREALMYISNTNEVFGKGFKAM